MPTPRKPNGRDLVDFRELVAMESRIKEDQARQSQSVIFRIDALDSRIDALDSAARPPLDRLAVKVDDLENIVTRAPGRNHADRIDSLEATRDVAKGRAMVVASITAAVISLVVGLIGFLARNALEPVAPHVTVTVQPQAIGSLPAATVVVIREPSQQTQPTSTGAATPRSSSSTASSPSPSPTPSSSPSCLSVGILDVCQNAAPVRPVRPIIGAGLIVGALGVLGFRASGR